MNWPKQNRDHYWKVFLRLIKEFGFPSIVALLWVVVSSKVESRSLDWTQLITRFGATFFIVSYFTAQLFRVSKQTWQEDKLHGIHSNLEIILAQLQSSAKAITDSITGGESFCYLTFTFAGHGDTGFITFVQEGKHPVYDVSARCVNLDKFDAVKTDFTLQNFTAADTYLEMSLLVSGYAATDFKKSIDLTGRDIARYNIFFTARNGGFTQLLRYARVGGAWKRALRIEKDTKILKEVIDPDFPPEKIDWKN